MGEHSHNNNRHRADFVSAQWITTIDRRAMEQHLSVQPRFMTTVSRNFMNVRWTAAKVVNSCLLMLMAWKEWLGNHQFYAGWVRPTPRWHPWRYCPWRQSGGNQAFQSTSTDCLTSLLKKGINLRYMPPPWSIVVKHFYPTMTSLTTLHLTSVRQKSDF